MLKTILRGGYKKYYVLVNKHKILVPYWTLGDAQKAIETIYRAQYPVATLLIIYEK